MNDLVPIRRALLSVSDKTDLVPFARRLASLGVELVSTGGTARALTEAGLTVRPIDDLTQFPEMMDGRVKTLHPRVHGGLLALRDNDAHVRAMTEHGIEPIDLVCVNLYPFEQTIAREDVTDAHAIENIDIGGPSMIRSAAKNHAFVTVVTDPAQYDRVVNELDQNGGATTFPLRRRLAGSAFFRTAAYDTAIAAWMAGHAESALPPTMILRLDRHPVDLRYGENPHQDGAVYRTAGHREPALTTAEQLHGKALSFNNYYDGNGALELVKEIDPDVAAAASVIKHANPCGFAVADNVADAFDKAYAGDPLAAFGGILAFNQPVSRAAAEKVVEGQKFLEVIIAPSYDDQALKILQERWKNVRLLATGPLPRPADRDPAEMEMKKITGGLLVQERDLAGFDPTRWEHQAGPAPDDDLLMDATLAMMAVKHLKSNAISLVRDRALVGAGAGQMDRVASCRLAVEKAGDRATGAVAGSDAFFPFRDGPDALINAAVKAIVQPGGSKRDDQTIAACNDAGVTCLFTGRRHFRH
ncbi:MAG: bifunctional phosphoribosylaminoimidazolecarboxamide formyltransferase/IMP cyclohydrolase [Planctomycetes bacterium]|nr:bifunctional phosphoribosylaminoimidazolecarboxamide formyltransferase/IMP cyclohydrolase [Planctomycetota bacterium]